MSFIPVFARAFPSLLRAHIDPNLNLLLLSSTALKNFAKSTATVYWLILVLSLLIGIILYL